MSSTVGIQWAMILLGGAIGALLRFEIGYRLRTKLAESAAATLLVNLSGCLLAGALLGLGGRWSDGLLEFLVAGVLGSYTTVSALALESVVQWHSGQRGAAAAYLAVTLVGGLIAAGVGGLVAKGLTA